jgi:hypothetical protein
MLFGILLSGDCMSIFDRTLDGGAGIDLVANERAAVNKDPDRNDAVDIDIVQGVEHAINILLPLDLTTEQENLITVRIISSKTTVICGGWGARALSLVCNNVNKLSIQ